MNIYEIIDSGDMTKIEPLFKKKELEVTYEQAKEEYDVKGHKVFNPTSRPDKVINKDTGEVREDGTPITNKVNIEVARIGVPLQEMIVEQRIGFMLSLPVKYNMLSEDEQGRKMIDRVNYILEKNRMDFKNKDILRKQMSEMECAELWYFSPAEDYDTKLTMKCMLLSPSLNDTLLPLYDEFGDMIAFGRKYKLKENEKEIEHFDIYTAKAEYRYINREKWMLDTLTDINGKLVPNPIPNNIGKIPIVYHYQSKPEWYKSQTMIDRLEESMSNHADMNDYFGSPILAISGEVLGFSQKGEQGKIIELSEQARANYLQLTTPPESILKEQSNLRELSLSMCSTADISFDKVKGIGNLSAVALNLLFISSAMAAKTKEETFSVNLQRRLSILMSAIGNVIDTKLKPAISKVKYNPAIEVYVPQDIESILKYLGQAYTDQIISLSTVVENNPLVQDKSKELDAIKKEQEENNVVTNPE